MYRLAAALCLAALMTASAPVSASESALVGAGDGTMSNCHSLTVLVDAAFLLQGVQSPFGLHLAIQATPGPQALCPQAWASSFPAVSWDASAGGCVDNALAERLCLSEPQALPGGEARYTVAWLHRDGTARGTLTIERV